jgi:hypothetical protein
MLKLLVMSMMFSAVAGDGCPNQCTGAQTENCLRPSGHLEITAQAAGVTNGASGLITIERSASGLIVGANAFQYCTALTSVSMPEVIEIGSSAFFGCTSLKTVSMPKVVWIKAGAFDNTGLTWVHMPKVLSIATNAFVGTPYSTKNPWQDKTALKVQYSSLGC